MWFWEKIAARAGFGRKKQTAQDIVQQYWPENRLPVEPVLIASKMGVAVLAVDDPDLGGCFLPKQEGQPFDVILYNAAHSPAHQRFVIAHELGHKVLHGTEKDRLSPPDLMSDTPDLEEFAANRFAAELLMPTHLVHAIVQVRGVTRLTRLANLFSVTTSAMKWRLQQLGYAVVV